MEQIAERYCLHPALVYTTKNKWMVAKSVDGSKRSKPVVVFHESTADDSLPAARFLAEVLNEKAKRERVVKSIIMGFIGGIFEGGGLRARPTGISLAPGKSRTAKVIYSLVDADGLSL